MAVYWRLIQMNIKAHLQYKGWSMSVVSTLFVVLTDPLAVVLLFARFGTLGAWRFEQIMLCYAFCVGCFGFAELLMRGFDYFPYHMLRTGGFDRLLLRPAPLFWQVAGSFFHIHRFTRAISGTAVTIWCFSRLRVVLSPERLVVLLLAAFACFLLYCAVFMMIAGIAFWTISSMEFFNVLTNGSYQAVRVPPSYLPNAMRRAYTFVFPLLVVSTMPLSWVCGWGAPFWQALLPLPAALVFLAFSLLIWHIGVSRYQSTGS